MRIVVPESDRPDEAVAAAAAVHAASARIAYADIFPPSATPPTPADLVPIWRSMMTDPGWSVLLAIDDPPRPRPAPSASSAPSVTLEAAIGVVAVGPDPTVPTGRVMAKLHVRPDRWGIGVGAALHDRALERIHDDIGLNLWVLERNHRARAFYRRRGWRLVPGPTLANDPPEVVDVLYQLGPGPRERQRRARREGGRDR